MLVCVDANSHQIRWKHEAAGPVESTPVIGDDDTIYFGDDAGTIHAVDFAGQPRWTAQFEAPIRSAGTILAPGRLAFGLDNGTLVVLRMFLRRPGRRRLAQAPPHRGAERPRLNGRLPERHPPPAVLRPGQLTASDLAAMLGGLAGTAPAVDWGISSVGRASGWHPEGQGFEPPILHYLCLAC